MWLVILYKKVETEVWPKPPIYKDVDILNNIGNKVIFVDEVGKFAGFHKDGSS